MTAPGTSGGRAVQQPDEVDLIVAAWSAQRPDLELAPLQVLSRIDRLAHHLDARRRRAFAAHDLVPWEFDVLAALRRAGPPHRLTPGALLAQTLVTSGTMTTRIDRLAERGLVVRHPDPSDRRSVLVELTPAGKLRVDAALAALLAFEDALLGAISPSAAAELEASLRELLGRLEGPAKC